MAKLAAILFGGGVGLLLGKRLSPGIQDIRYTGFRLAILVLGIQMALKMENFIIVIFRV